jgi:hypothetical protein
MCCAEKAALRLVLILTYIFKSAFKIPPPSRNTPVCFFLTQNRWRGRCWCRRVRGVVVFLELVLGVVWVWVLCVGGAAASQSSNRYR